MSTLIRPALLGAVVLFACSPPKTPAAGEEAFTITPEGGTLEALGVRLDVPKGAVASDVTVRLVIVDEDVAFVSGRDRASLTYRFEPETLLDRQVTLSVPWLDARVPAGVDLRTLDLRRRSTDESASPVPEATTNLPNRVVGGATNRLSTFWVTAPVRPVGLVLKIEPAMVGLEYGGTQELTISLTDPAGVPVEGVPIRFTMVTPRVAKLVDGRVTALAPGHSLLRAQAGPAEATVDIYVLGTAPGPNAFTYDNPFPTGNDLWGASQLGLEAVFAGENGTVLTLDETSQWSRLTSFPAVSLRSVDGPTARTSFAVGVSGVKGVLVDVARNKRTDFDNLNLRIVSYDGTTGLAAGRGSDVLWFSQGQWKRVASPTAQTVLAVRRDANGFTVVGNKGSIYQLGLDGTWAAVELGELAVQLDFATFDDGRVWATGDGYLWEWALAGWAARALPDPRARLTAMGTLEGKLTLAADDGRLWLQQGAGVWTMKRLRSPQIARGIGGGWVVGEHGAVWQSFNGSLSELSRGFYGNVVDLAAATGVVVAAVKDCSDFFCSMPIGHVMMREGPAQWAELGAPFIGGVSSVLAFSPTEIYVGGPGVKRWTGDRWVDVEMGTAAGAVAPYVTDLAFCGSRLYAAAGTRIFAGPRSGPLVPGEPIALRGINAITCNGTDSVWAVGAYGVFENGEPRYWGRVRSPPWETVFSPAKNEAFVFGPATYGGYWNGEELLEVSNPGDYELSDVGASWGTFDNLYIAGATWSPVRGYVARFDGLNWQALECGAQRPLHAAGGTSQLWLGGEGGAILRGVFQ